MKTLITFILLSFEVLASDGRFHLFLRNHQGRHSLSPRDIYVYLPPGYSKKSRLKYPVVYMHDGQNAFDPQRGYAGQTWNAESTLNHLIKTHQIRPLIVVAIDNSPGRMWEYTHDRDPGENAGGGAQTYLSYVVNELKPIVDQNLNTNKHRDQTGIMGSSLGGLLSLYAGIRYNENFGLVAALSPSLWWNNLSLLEIYKRAPQLPLKIYLDSGTVGGERPEDVLRFEDLLKPRFTKPQSLKTFIQEGANHSEQFWAQRLPLALSFLFPPTN